MPKVTSQDASMQPDPADLSIVAAKLDEILMLLRANMNNNSLNVSDVLKWVNTNTSTPLPGMQSVTIVPVEDVVMEVPGTSAADPTSLIYFTAMLKEGKLMTIFHHQQGRFCLQLFCHRTTELTTGNRGGHGKCGHRREGPFL